MDARESLAAVRQQSELAIQRMKRQLDKALHQSAKTRRHTKRLADQLKEATKRRQTSRQAPSAGVSVLPQMTFGLSRQASTDQQGANHLFALMESVRRAGVQSPVASSGRASPSPGSNRKRGRRSKRHRGHKHRKHGRGARKRDKKRSSGASSAGSDGYGR